MAVDPGVVEHVRGVLAQHPGARIEKAELASESGLKTAELREVMAELVESGVAEGDEEAYWLVDAPPLEEDAPATDADESDPDAPAGAIGYRATAEFGFNFNGSDDVEVALAEAAEWALQRTGYECRVVRLELVKTEVVFAAE